MMLVSCTKKCCRSAGLSFSSLALSTASSRSSTKGTTGMRGLVGPANVVATGPESSGVRQSILKSPTQPHLLEASDESNVSKTPSACCRKPHSFSEHLLLVSRVVGIGIDLRIHERAPRHLVPRPELA